jgi:hypothetical protein
MSLRDKLTIAFILLSVLLALLLVRERRRRRRAESAGARSSILFPFDERTFCPSAVDLTLRIAQSDGAVVIPTYIAIVPMRVSLEAPVQRQSLKALPFFDRIQDQADSLGVPLDCRIQPGRSYRHSMRRAFELDDFDRVVIAAAGTHGLGFSSEDVAWALDHSESQLLVLKTSDSHPTAGSESVRLDRIFKA